MSWLELDDGILDHPKFIRAVKLGGSETVHLWLGIKSYCNKQLTDGLVPTDMLDEVRGPKDAKKRMAALAALIEVKLLDNVENGVQMHNYLKWSRSRADVLESRRKNSERQAKSRGSHSVTARVVTPSVTDPSPLLSPSSPPPTPEGERAPRVDRFTASLQQADPEDAAVLEAWRVKFRRRKEDVLFTADRALPIALRRAEGMTQQDAIDALDGAAQDAWFIGQGAKLSLVFNDRERFEAFRDAGRDQREGRPALSKVSGKNAPRQPDSGYRPHKHATEIT